LHQSNKLKSLKNLRNISFRRSLNAIIILIVTIVALCIGAYFIFDENKELKEQLSDLEKHSRDKQEAVLKHEVNRVIDYINHKRKNAKEVPDNLLQNQILTYIESVRFKRGGYVFINTFQGKALIFDGQIIQGDKYINDMTDPDGKRIYDLELEAAQNPEGGFMDYKFKPLGSEGPEQSKISYMKGYKDWQWIIGAGFYLEDLNKEIAKLKEAYSSKLQNELLISLVSLIVLCFLLILFGQHFTKTIYLELNSFREFFSKFPEQNNSMDESSFIFTEFASLAVDANKMAEAKKKAEQKLKISEENYKSLIEQAADAILKGGMKGNLLEVNAAASYLTGYSRNELLNMNIADLFTSQMLKQKPLRYDKLNLGQSVIVERDIVTKNDKEIPVEMNSRKMAGDFYISIIRDISERKKVEEELHQHRNHLEELVKERTSELEDKNKELERFNDLFVGREFRIKELKQKIKSLETEIREN